MSEVDLAGVFIPAVTPFDPVTGEVDVVGFRSNLRVWLEHDLRGIVVGGSTGEALLLDEEERLLLLESARDVVPAERLVVAGTGAESTRLTIRRCQAAARAGVDAVLVQPPAFYKGAMTPEALVRHYRAVADGSPVPVIVYQVPLRLSTLEFPTGLVAELAHHDNVIGIKDSRGDLDLLGELFMQCPPGFQILVGSGALLYAGLEIGAVGGILAVANMAPSESALLYSAFRAGDHARAGGLQERIGPVHHKIVGGMGVPGVKAGVSLLGLRGGQPRPPLSPLPERRVAEVEKILAAASLLA